MSQVKDTKKALMQSKVWAAATRDLNVEAMVKTGPLALDDWDDDTHNLVQSWAGEGGEMPEVVATYLALFDESGETPECWGNDAARPDEIQVEAPVIEVSVEPDGTNKRKFKVEIGVSDPAVVEAIKSQGSVRDSDMGHGLILRREERPTPDGLVKTWAWIYTVPGRDSTQYGNAYGWEDPQDEFVAQLLAKNGAREFLSGMMAGRYKPDEAPETIPDEWDG